MKKLLLVVAMLGLVGCGGPSAEQRAVLDATRAAEETMFAIMGPSPDVGVRWKEFREASDRVRKTLGRESQPSRDLAEIEALLGELERGRDVRPALRAVNARLTAQYQSSGAK